MTVQKRSACSSMNRGPGVMPLSSRALRTSAMTGVKGMPRDISGMKAEPAAALLAVSGPATPSMAPLPNSSGCLDSRFSVT